jgi:hypothetical protein
MQRGTLRLPKVILALALLAGCTHWHYERNAPGQIDVLKPPERPLPCDEQERPRDPGEHMLLLFPTAYVGGGGVGLGKQGQGAFATGVEASLLYGANEWSHSNDALFFPVPQDGFGLNLGLFGFSRRDHLLVYGELLLRRSMVSVSPGWAWNPQTHQHGPQLTLSGMLLYARATHLLGVHTDVSVGIYLDVVLAWIWSR